MRSYDLKTEETKLKMRKGPGVGLSGSERNKKMRIKRKSKFVDVLLSEHMKLWLQRYFLLWNHRKMLDLKLLWHESGRLMSRRHQMT